MLQFKNDEEMQNHKAETLKELKSSDNEYWENMMEQIIKEIRKEKQKKEKKKPLIKLIEME